MVIQFELLLAAIFAIDVFFQPSAQEYGRAIGPQIVSPQMTNHPQFRHGYGQLIGSGKSSGSGGPGGYNGLSGHGAPGALTGPRGYGEFVQSGRSVEPRRPGGYGGFSDSNGLVGHAGSVVSGVSVSNGGGVGDGGSGRSSGTIGLGTLGSYGVYGGYDGIRGSGQNEHPRPNGRASQRTSSAPWNNFNV